MEHVCKLNDIWPMGHPLPPEDPAKLRGPKVGAEVTYRHVTTTGRYDPEVGEVVYKAETHDQRAVVLHRSYVWSPGECRAKGGYRNYEWSVIVTVCPGTDTLYTVVVDDKQLIEGSAS